MRQPFDESRRVTKASSRRLFSPYAGFSPYADKAVPYTGRPCLIAHSIASEKRSSSSRVV